MDNGIGEDGDGSDEESNLLGDEESLKTEKGKRKCYQQSPRGILAPLLLVNGIKLNFS